MRQIVLIVALLFIFLKTPGDQVSAACRTYSPALSCKERCLNTDPSQCCDTPEECSAITTSGDCNPITNSTCPDDLRCIWISGTTWECAVPKSSGGICRGDADCADGLSCVYASEITRVCAAPGEDPAALVYLNEFTNVCSYIKNADDYGRCTSCHNNGNVWTALGCLPTNSSRLINYLLTFGIGIAGGIAFLLILVGGFQIMTSVGNPEQLNAGKELVGSAVTGLILIIFSVFLLKVIGYNILRIPGFGG